MCIIFCVHGICNSKVGCERHISWAKSMNIQWDSVRLNITGLKNSLIGKKYSNFQSKPYTVDWTCSIDPPCFDVKTLTTSIAGSFCHILVVFLEAQLST